MTSRSLSVLFFMLMSLGGHCQMWVGIALLDALSRSTAKKAIPLSYVLDTTRIEKAVGKELRKKRSDQIDSINRLISKDRKNSKLYVSRARLRESLEIFAGAREDYMYAYELKDRSRDFLMSFGTFSRNHGQRANAVTCFNSLIKRDSTDSEAYLYRGITILYVSKSRLNSLKERCEESLPDFIKAVRYDSTSIPALTLRGYCDYYLGYNEAALQYLNQAVTREPTQVSFVLLGQTYLEADQPDNACAVFKKGITAGFEMPEKLVKRACNY